MKNKLEITIAGGRVRSTLRIGVIKYLEEKNIKINGI